ncbi:MAG TPA: response regulator receiver protein [Clostridiales bacterium]|nr:response regulator receiver protein [Clostridiales bacterium]
MDNALIISGTEKSIEWFSALLGQNGCPEIVTVHTGGDARRMLLGRDFDLCIVNAPLSDEFGENLAMHIASDSPSQVILLVKSDVYEEVSAHVEESGVLTLSKPVQRAFFWNALKLASAAHRKTRQVHHENKRLLQKIEDIRIIDRAKCTLISRFNLTEEEAHKVIEKQAMDMRLTKRIIAEGILKNHEN